jgi:hypothetical protein
VHALRQGLARAASAPAVLVGAIAVLWWLKGPADTRNAVAGLLLWTFLSGGILDRYARGHAIRARGFFGACGAHWASMVRLGLIIVLITAGIHGALASRVADPYVGALAIGLLSAVALVAVYGQIRLVVEDRRSAFAALLAATRFVRRNPASIGLFVLNGLLMWAGTAAALAVLPQAATAWPGGLATVLHSAILAYLILALYAAALVLFQSRLAHAGYTAAPPIEWPDSPAAEAIGNASTAAS